MSAFMPSIDGLDHVDIVVADLADAYARLLRLGFTVAPPSGSEAAAHRTKTCAIAFPHLYLAFSGSANPSALTEPMRSYMTRPGAGGMLLRAADMESAIADATARGLTAAPVSEFGRPLETASGVQEVRFRVASLAFPDGERSGSRMFALIQHLRADLIWNGGSVRHPNGARGVAFVFSRVDDLAPVRRGLSRLLGEPLPGDATDTLTFDAVTARRRFALPATFAARFPGLDKSTDTVIGIRMEGDIAAMLETAGLSARRVRDGLMLAGYLPSVAFVLTGAD